MKQITLISAALLLLSVIGCTPQETITKIPELKAISETTVEATAEGGFMKVDYTITDPIENGEITTACQADWLSDIKTSESFTTFNITGNQDSEARECTLTVIYDYISGLDSISFTIKQEGAELPPEPPAFTATLEVLGTSWNTAEIKISPSDESIYFVGICEKAAFDQLSDEEVFSSTLQQYAGHVSTPTELIEQFGKSGEYTYRPDGLESLTEYICYLFKTDMNGLGEFELLSEIFSTSFTTEEQEIIEFTVDFDLELNSTTLNLKAIPSDKEQYYYLNIASPMDLFFYSSGTTEEKLTNFINDNVKTYLDFGMADNIADIPDVYNGDQSKQYSDLSAGDEYFVIAAAIDEYGDICSDLTFESFTPEEITSDASITYTAKCFDGTEVAQKYPEQYGDAMGKIVVVFEKEFSDNTAGYLWSIYDGDYSNLTSDQIKNDLIGWGREGDMSVDRDIVIYKAYNLEFSVLLLAYDENRYYGESSATVYSFSKEDASPIEEFIP